MMLRDTIVIDAGPEAVFGFFDGMDQARYLSWHPDHKVFRWTRGRGLAIGNRFYFEEVIAGKLLKKEMVFTRIDASRHIEFAPTFWLLRLFLPRFAFRLEAQEGGRWRFVAEIVVRTGPIGARLNQREFDAVREHMRIEGINLKRFVESGAAAMAAPSREPAPAATTRASAASPSRP